MATSASPALKLAAAGEAATGLALLVAPAWVIAWLLGGAAAADGAQRRAGGAQGHAGGADRVELRRIGVERAVDVGWGHRAVALGAQLVAQIEAAHPGAGPIGAGDPHLQRLRIEHDDVDRGGVVDRRAVAEREAGVVRLRFGLTDGQPRTLDEIGQVYGVTRERIRQIESKTMSKLRHPSRSQVLRDYLD